MEVVGLAVKSSYTTLCKEFAVKCRYLFHVATMGHVFPMLGLSHMKALLWVKDHSSHLWHPE